MTAHSERIEQLLGDRIICTTCGARAATVATKCSVALDVACQGFEVIDAAIEKIAREDA